MSPYRGEADVIWLEGDILLSPPLHALQGLADAHLLTLSGKAAGIAYRLSTGLCESWKGHQEHPAGQLVGHARNGVTHNRSIAVYDPPMVVLEKIFLVIELLLVLGLVTRITFGV